MAERNAEQYRKELERLYKSCVTDSISFDEVVCLEEGKNKFIIGRQAKKEDVAESGVWERGNSAYTSVKSTIFCASLENGELTKHPLFIVANSHTAYEIDAIGHDVSCPACSDVMIRISGGNFYFMANEKGFVDVTNPQEISRIVEQNLVRQVASDLHFNNGKVGDGKEKYEQVTKLVGRFVAPIASFDSIVKGEKDRLKRVERFGALRKIVEKKREKIAKAQEKLRAKREKEQKALQQKKVNAFLGK